jgi:hypothetical protein
MARSVALSTLVTRAQRRVPDGESDDSIVTAEWKSRISEAYAELHAMLRPARYFETEATITATGASGYALPSDHRQTITVDFLYSSNQRRPLGLITAAERARFAGYTGEAYRYAIEGSNIVLYPTPSSGTYKHLYIPQPTDYSSSSDATSVDVIDEWGEKFIIYAAAVMALDERESDATRAIQEREMARSEIQLMAADRIMANPPRPDTDDTRWPDPYGYPLPWGWR